MFRTICHLGLKAGLRASIKGFAAAALTLLCVAFPSIAHEGHSHSHHGHDNAPRANVIYDSWFTPAYTLPGNGANTPGQRPMPPQSPEFAIGYAPRPLDMYGMEPTDRVTHLLGREQLPSLAFTAELWALDHVNQRVGALVAAKGDNANSDVAWTLGYTSGKILMTVGGTDGLVLEVELTERGFKKYWGHVVGTYDGTTARIYMNGKEIASAEHHILAHDYAADTQLEIAGYFENEPFMEIGNLVQHLRVSEGVMSADQINKRFVQLARAVENGVRFPGHFHFTAGPTLNMAVEDGVNIIAETDRNSTAVLYYGQTLPLDRTMASKSSSRLHEFAITGLESAKRYYYQVTVVDSSGERMDSGLLSFKTAEPAGSPISFAVIGDTEARPHINNQIAQRVWQERPDFVITTGDLSDGGKKDHRFQWTHEYHLGTEHLHGRVPSFPVPGNGESDLYWYNHYHMLPLEPKGYYTFRYGDAQFFMLDSNKRGKDFMPGGEQYEWLKRELEKSGAKWKFAAHHHPVFTSDENDYGNTWKGEPSPMGDVDVQPISELYEKHGIDLVFFGHLHSYERSWPLLGDTVNMDKGVVYIQSGGAGGNLEDYSPSREWFSRKTYPNHHYCVIKIIGDTLEFKMYDIDGDLRDTMNMNKSTENVAATTSRTNTSRASYNKEDGSSKGRN